LHLKIALIKIPYEKLSCYKSSKALSKLNSTPDARVSGA